MQFYEINICRVIIFCLYTVYKKYKNDINWRSNNKKIASSIFPISQTQTIVCDLNLPFTVGSNIILELAIIRSQTNQI